MSLSVSPVRVAVLGDSDSHSYQDRLWVGPGTPERGGAYRATTFQWGEILARLRPTQVDLGAWGRWGTRRTVVRLLDSIGIHLRTPRKQDFRYNFAFAGATCADLMAGHLRQAPRLVALMNAEPERWRDGVVVIRIGVVTFGMASSLDQLARDAAAPRVMAAMSGCLAQIEAAVSLIRLTHPTTRVVLVGILDNADFPFWFEKWQSPLALANISEGLDVFDRGLRRIATIHPGIVFFDDRQWFAERWGRRGADGVPNRYKTVEIGKKWQVRHAAGDHPGNSVLQDGHAGVAWNALWAQSLVQCLNASFDAGIDPITDDELSNFLIRLVPSTL